MMKLIVTAWLLMLLQVSASTYAQKVTLRIKNASLKEVLDNVQKQTKYDFMYNAEQVKVLKPITLDVHNTTLTEVLDLCLKGQGFDYVLDNKVVVIRRSRTTTEESVHELVKPNIVKALQQTNIVGFVTDEKGKPMNGVSVHITSSQGQSQTIQTVDRGAFAAPGFFVSGSAQSFELTFSYVGYNTHRITIKPNHREDKINVQLTPEEQEIGEVIVTGMFERKKETFTGATASFSGEELKMISNTNIIQSLKTLDPSFLVMENNLSGSNPNILPNIELRGQTSISTEGLRDEFSSDPNQPLFILDGFETTLRTIVDLDVNRIASVTILKDAASTAAYGSRASNGIVVVETVRPKAGELLVNYTTDGNIEFADLSGYNMMNAAEKIEFERLSGRFTAHPIMDNYERQVELDNLYSHYLNEIVRGVDSYWLSEPLRTGFSQRHSLMISGGENAITYSLGGDYRYQNGVMKGSGRNTWGTRLNLGYRAGKFNVTNNLYVNGYDSKESKYGQFSTWVNTNPYYEKKDATEKYLAEIRQYRGSFLTPIYNPLYATTIPNSDKSKSFEIVNNLRAIYQINTDLRIESSLQINKSTLDRNIFRSPLDLSFENTILAERGTLRSTRNDKLSYTANIGGQYGRTFNQHLINALLRFEVSDRDDRIGGFYAVGFPSNSNGNPRFAYGYASNGKPQAAQSIFRRNSIVSSFNYSYDRRYNADLSFTYDGSTSFGTNNTYSPFFSAGLSWNVNNESFMKEVTWIDLLRLRANIGITGNQNFSSYTSISTYDYYRDNNDIGQGIYMSALGNPDLKWQNTTQTSVGIDANMLGNRLSAQLNAYRKYTDPMVVAVNRPLSTALYNYPINAGSLTVEGIEAILRYSPIYKPSERTVWTIGLTTSMVDQTYSNFGKTLENLNKELQNSRVLNKYRDGGSPYDIWTVRSLGIDPMTGNELFLKKDGTYTFQYDWEDEVVVGNSAPRLQGIFSNNVSYKGFTMGLNFRYIINQGIFNTALFNKVENISWSDMVNKNQDKRALYSRWKEMGDIVEFRRIQLNDWDLRYNNSIGYVEQTLPSSRFVQKENTFALESASLGYELRSKPWMQQARLSNLRLTGYMNDIFRISTVKRERGIDYPYAKMVSFSLSANFH